MMGPSPESGWDQPARWDQGGAPRLSEGQGWEPIRVQAELTLRNPREMGRLPTVDFCLVCGVGRIWPCSATYTGLQEGADGKEVALPTLQRPHPSSTSSPGFGPSPHMHLLVRVRFRLQHLPTHSCPVPPQLRAPPGLFFTVTLSSILL